MKLIPASECEAWSKANPLAALWNRTENRKTIRRVIKSNLRCSPQGKGNRAWKRAETINRNPAILIWPNYL